MRKSVIIDTFSANLKRIHNASGLKQSFVAMNVGVDKSAIQYWMNKVNFPAPEKIEKLAEIYGIDWLEFFLPIKEEEAKDE